MKEIEQWQTKHLKKTLGNCTEEPQALQLLTGVQSMNTRRKTLMMRFFNKIRTRKESLAGKIWIYRKEKAMRMRANGEIITGFAADILELCEECDLTDEWQKEPKCPEMEWNYMIDQRWKILSINRDLKTLSDKMNYL